MLKVKPPANYFGGKAGPIGALIASLLPEHKIYVEPFGGMGGVLFHKKPSLVEVYNDADSRIVNLFRVLRCAKDAKNLLAMIKLTPYSRECYIEAHEVLRHAGKEQSIRTAWATYLAISLATQPSMRLNGFRFGGPNFQSSVARMWKTRNTNLEQITERITDWVIENQEATKVMVRYNQPDCLIYCDPPYVHSTRNQIRVVKKVRDYHHEMDDVEHEIFLMVASGLKAKCLISGYNNELYSRMLKGWSKLEVPVTSGIAAANCRDDDNGARMEVIWANFPLEQQLQIF